MVVSLCYNRTNSKTFIMQVKLFSKLLKLDFKQISVRYILIISYILYNCDLKVSRNKGTLNADIKITNIKTYKIE